MKKLLFTLGTFLHAVLCLPIQAETATIDSLKRELQLAEQKNSTKEQLIELYQFLGAEYETLDLTHPITTFKKDFLFIQNRLLKKKDICSYSTHWLTIFSWKEK